MVIKGFKFGLLLQFAIGPVCLFIFQTATSIGLSLSLLAVLGVTLVDALFVFLAIAGIASLLKSERTQKLLKVCGALILIIFGLSTILSQFSINLIPSLGFQATSTSSVFLKAIIITISNPLTIIFWAGVFSSKIIEEKMSKSDVYLFGLGAVSSTAIFLSAIAILGSITMNFLPTSVIQILNIGVGVMLIYYGIRLFIKKA